MATNTPTADEPNGLPFVRLWSVDTGRFILFGDLRRSGLDRMTFHLLALVFALLASAATPQIARMASLRAMAGNPVSPPVASLVDMGSWLAPVLVFVVLVPTLVGAARAFIEQERGYRQEDRALDEQP